MSSERSAVGAGRRVLLGGWYGAANLGDELVFGALVRWLREAGATPTAVSVHPQLTWREHGVASVGYGDLPAIAEALAEADAFVLGGGGLFQDYEPFDRAALARFPSYCVAQYAQFARLAYELGVPVGVLAQGVGPLRGTDARGIAAETFALAQEVSVRDAASASLLREIGVTREVPVAPDPGWTLRARALDVAPLYPALAGHRVLAIVVRDWPFDRSWEAPFVAALRTGVPSGWGCLWLDFARLPDAQGEAASNDEIAGRLVAQLPGLAHAVWRGMRVDEAVGLIAGSDALVAMRLHAVLLGHACERPVLALEYDDKVRSLGDDVGAPAALRIALPDVARRMPAALDELMAGGAFRMPAATRDRLAARALVHRDVLLRLLEVQAGVRAPPPPALPALLPGWMAALDDTARARVAAARGRVRGVTQCG